jgi:hypothetical protein
MSSKPVAVLLTLSAVACAPDIFLGTGGAGGAGVGGMGGATSGSSAPSSSSGIADAAVDADTADAGATDAGVPSDCSTCKAMLDGQLGPLYRWTAYVRCGCSDKGPCAPVCGAWCAGVYPTLSYWTEPDAACATCLSTPGFMGCRTEQSACSIVRGHMSQPERLRLLHQQMLLFS